MKSISQKDQELEDLWEANLLYARFLEPDIQAKLDHMQALCRTLALEGQESLSLRQRTRRTRDSDRTAYFYENIALTERKTHHKTEGGRKYTAIFSAGNVQHIDLFLPLHEYMKNFDILYLVTASLGKRKRDLENYIRSLNIQYIFISPHSTDDEIKSILMQINPDIVIVAHDTASNESTLIKNSNSLGIPTLLVQDGIYSSCEYYQDVKKGILTKTLRVPKLLLDHDYTIHEKIKIILDSIEVITQPKPPVGRGNCTRVAVFGEATKQLLEQEGVDPRKIIVTGSPKFDFLNFQNCNGDCSVYTELEVNPNDNTILLITQPFVGGGIWTQSQREEYVSQICSAVKNVDNCRLIIKIRQSGENVREYNEIVDSSGINPIICEDIRLFKLIKIADLAITVSSTGGLEAIVAEKPLIIFDPFRTPNPLFYNSEGILYSDSADDLAVTVNKLLYDDHFREFCIQKQNSFLARNIHRSSRPAAERIYNTILELINYGGL